MLEIIKVNQDISQPGGTKLPIPSFDELLAQARRIGEYNADSQYPKTGLLAAKGATEFVNNLLNFKTSDQKTYSGYLTREGDFSAFDKPYSTGGTVLQMLANRIRGGNPSVPQGAIPLVQDDATAAFLKTLPTTVIDPVSGRQITQTLGRPTLLQQPKEPPKVPMQMQKAISSGFTRPDEVKNLFPELHPDQYSNISVSEVMNRRANARAEIIAGLRSASPEEAKDLASGDVISSEIDRIKELVKKTGGKGLGFGNYQRGKIGQYIPIDALKTDPDTSDLYTLISDVNNQMIYLRSGKQINEQENKRLLDAQLDPNLNADLFARRLDTFDTNFIKTIAARKDRIQGAGRRIGEGEPRPKPFQPKTGSQSGMTDAQRKALQALGE